MLAIYIVSAVVGGILVLLSALGGHGDASHDHDFAPGHDHEVTQGGEVPSVDHTWIPFLSLRLWTYFFAAFGLAGLLLTKVAGLPEPITAWLSAGTGFLSGLSISWAMRLVSRSEADSSATVQDMLGAEAKVLVPIRGDQLGKIRLTVKGDTIELLALNQDDSETLAIGDDVVIVAVEKDTARVVPRATVYG